MDHDAGRLIRAHAATEATLEFALNQKTAPALPFEDFLDLATALGCVGVESRADLGRSVFDGIDPARAADMARVRGLRFVGLSEVYPFNDWNDERRDAVSRLIETARRAGAETLSLIPRVDRRDPDAAESAAVLRAVLAEILRMTEGTGVVALVEPIGFTTSSVRCQREATEAIESLGAGGRLGIVHDTFQHALARDPDYRVEHIRLVHVSGISGGAGALTDDLDGERVAVGDDDRTDTVGQMRCLLNAGYRGLFSFECTSSVVQGAEDPEALLAASIAHIKARLGG